MNAALYYHHNNDRYHTPLHYGQNMHQYSYKVQQPYPDKTLSVYVLFSAPFPNKQLKSRHHNIMKMYIDWLFRQENDFQVHQNQILPFNQRPQFFSLIAITGCQSITCCAIANHCYITTITRNTKTINPFCNYR